MNGMNGWQRLWVVVCILVAIPLMLIGEALVPTKEDITQKFEKELATEKGLLNLLNKKDAAQVDFNQRFFGETALEDTEAKILDLETRHQSELDSLWLDRLKIRGTISASWLVICIALYSMGLVIGWVTQGFRPKRD